MRVHTKKQNQVELWRIIMFVPFEKEDLGKKPFVKNEILFNLFHIISQSETEVSLKTTDGNLIALCSPGRSMWLWINEELGLNKKSELLVLLAGELLGKNITGVVAEQDIAGGFAACYAELMNAKIKKDHGLIAYSCSDVIEPEGVKGKMLPSHESHTEAIAKCLAGFSIDAHHVESDLKSKIIAAEKMIDEGNLYVWYVDGHVVSTAKIGYKVAGFARINTVYTFPDKRKNGYASALIAGVSKIALNGNLTPVLYTDMTNPATNKMYKNIGYVEKGRLDSFSFIY